LRLVLTKQSLKRTLRWTQHALLVGGVSLLAYCSFALLDSWIFQQQQGHDLDRLLDDDSAASVRAPPRTSAPGSAGSLGCPVGSHGRRTDRPH
jgi:hypothetical protein